jgi:hypothetical protein
VVVLGIVTAVVWQPVYASLHPTFAVAEDSGYVWAEERLHSTFEGHNTDPLGFPGSDFSARLSVAYLEAAEDYIDEYIREYDATDRIYDSEDEVITAGAEAIDEFGELGRALEDGGVGTPLATQSFPQAPEIVALEQQIAAMPVVAGADGTYWDTAQAMASLLGAQLTTDTSLSDCYSFGSGDDTSAFFCSSEAGWGYVFIEELGMSEVGSTGFVDTVKHELAHKLIHIQCQASYNSFLDGATWSHEYGEGVTNSYAVLFLGADPANMFVEDDYAMNDVTDAKARAIHDGDLACFDNGVLPDSALG